MNNLQIDSELDLYEYLKDSVPLSLDKIDRQCIKNEEKIAMTLFKYKKGSISLALAKTEIERIYL